MNGLSRSTSVLAVLLTSLLWVPACGRPFESLYSKHYENGLTDVVLPSEKDIMASGFVKTYDIPANEMSRNCLRMAAQGQGILAVDSGADGNSPRRLMILTGEDYILVPASINNSMAATLFMDTWLAIAVVPNGPESCSVGVAWINPETNKTAAIDSAVDSNKSSNIFTTPGEKFRIAQEASSTAMAQKFHQNLLMQSYGPTLWMTRLKSPNPVTRGPAPGVEVCPDPGYPELKTGYGNWCSLYLRQHESLVNAPELIADFTRTLDNLKKAAGMAGVPMRIYILASPEINAFSLPNGDIYLFAGLLDILSDPHQIAAVLAHELDHFAQHDAVYKILHEYRTQVAVMTGMVVLSVAGGVAGALVAPASSALGQAVPVGQQLVSNGLQQVISTSITYGGMGLQNTLVMGYSQEVELRADNNGLRYVWAAGYDTKGMFQVMDKLKGIEVAAKDAKANCGSALVNCKPGVEARTAQLLKVQSELSKVP